MSDPEIWSTNLIKKFEREIWPSALSILHGIRPTCVRISTNFARTSNFNRNSRILLKFRAFCPMFAQFSSILPESANFASHFVKISSILPEFCQMFEHFARIRTTFCPNFEHFARILPKFRAFGPNSSILHQTPPCAIELRSKFKTGPFKGWSILREFR